VPTQLRFAQLIRLVAALEKLHQLPTQVTSESETQSVRSLSGLMTAARDLQEDESEPKLDDEGPKTSNEKTWLKVYDASR